jgi:MarR family transcriptional regulator, transcriptional regulator for hemolysin
MQFVRERSSGYMTNWAARLFARAIDVKLKPLGLSSAYMPVIFALAHGQALSQRALTEAASIEQPTMAATLARMERDGLVMKRPDPNDRRSSLYSLTPVGMEMTEKVRAAGHAVNAAAMEGLSEAEREAYLALLGKVVTNLGRSLDDSG